ncbi:hypothetical protein LTR53_002575 [Teratosphaeriaceae sp. CCFEE 6253]|nr:hypothetical protein LTR53_002575 [Teratosphaeriaceae sp. CCFEE 6253]
MADGTTGTVDKKYINYWIRNEHLPVEIGWRRRTVEMKGSERTDFSQRLKTIGEGQSSSGLGGSGSGSSGLGSLGSRLGSGGSIFGLGGSLFGNRARQ